MSNPAREGRSAGASHPLTGGDSVDSTEPRSGWSQQPIDSYETGDSGGWGGPGGALTGPIPRLRPPTREAEGASAMPAEATGPDLRAVAADDETREAAANAAEGPTSGSTASRAADATSSPTTDSTVVDTPGDAASVSAPPTATPGAPVRPATAPMAVVATPGGWFASLASPAGIRRAAPIVFWIVVLWLVLDAVGGLYAYFEAAAGGSRGLAGLFVLLFVSIFKVAALTVLTRLAVAAGVAVADLWEQQFAYDPVESAEEEH